MIYLSHPSTGQLKKAPTGFSWTALVFGIFVPLFRGDLKWLFLSILLSMLTAGIFWIVFAFIYNKLYIKGLLDKGYKPADEQSNQYLKTKGFIS